MVTLKKGNIRVLWANCRTKSQYEDFLNLSKLEYMRTSTSQHCMQEDSNKRG